MLLYGDYGWRIYAGVLRYALTDMTIITTHVMQLTVARGKLLQHGC